MPAGLLQGPVVTVEILVSCTHNVIFSIGSNACGLDDELNLTVFQEGNCIREPRSGWEGRKGKDLSPYKYLRVLFCLKVVTGKVKNSWSLKTYHSPRSFVQAAPSRMPCIEGRCGLGAVLASGSSTRHLERAGKSLQHPASWCGESSRKNARRGQHGGSCL